ncbi:TetR/AcrR family transcriptional regulator [Amycolatopsis cynarae]|uniref:TetR/AcrR family transcriptional regulator n=1 Tax=Amycolatopsis cynarae TaxID=2995223 RepID=A0ABY7B093_9PSEU|nr:TetR/AcrR family transcriptional regulator [Amycolatopsis sp. HUAS 11-8]WAL65352.1 TetR/AcrR family transcriptional regulator [Amycolatopsis sp. HUAS 11-8]
MNSPAKPTLRADARRNRARVLAAAQEAFADEGPSVPLDEIARRAGVGAGTVYRHFPSKESLFQAVVLDSIEQLTEQARERLTATDPGEAFFEYFRLVAERAVLNKALCDALAAAGGIEPSSAQRADFRGRMAELLARAQRAGAVRDDITAEDLVPLLSGYVAILRQSPGDLGRVITDGLRAHPRGHANRFAPTV